MQCCRSCRVHTLEKSLAWFSVSTHSCRSAPIVGALLGNPLGSQKREEQEKEVKRVEEKKINIPFNFFYIVYFGEFL